MQAGDVRSIRVVKEKNDHPPLADALNVLFRLFVQLLEKGTGDNQNHASSLEKMSNHPKAEKGNN